MHDIYITIDNGVQPHKAYPAEDAGWDLTANVRTIVEPQGFSDVPTGVCIALPSGLFGRITGRSSTWRRHHLMVVEGIIDTGYRGILCIGVYNPNNIPFAVEPGMRLAQLLIHEIPPVKWVEVQKLPASERGKAGFGSSGI